MTPQELIDGSRELRLKKARQQVEAQDAQQQFYGTVSGFDGAVGMYWVRIRGGSAIHGRSLSSAAYEAGEVVSAFLDQSGLLWIDKISRG
jgi:hypothetical protein